MRFTIATRQAGLMTGLCVLLGLGLVSSSPAATAPAGSAQPAIELGAPFTDHAVLQQQMPVPVWGWSRPGTEVTVRFAGQSKTATAGPDGKWMVRLDPMSASARPDRMVITESTGRRRVLDDILVGEVWLASGQSNMQWPVSNCNVGRVLLKQIAERVQAGQETQPIIREAKVTDVYAALHPIEHARGQWSLNVGDFSAIAYAFAYSLYRELKVPIGILNCSFSSTSIEAWTPRQGFAEATDPYGRDVYRRILEADPTTDEHHRAWSRFYQEIEHTLAENRKRVEQGQPARPIPDKTPGNLRGNRDACWLFNARLNPMVPYAIRGAIWNQGYANIGGGLTYYHNLHALVRGWRRCWGRPDLPVYFHQFYCPGQKGQWNTLPTIEPAAEMRLGTWLARDIPHADMASQIDITGAVHYFNKVVPGRRLARLALKNQYGRKVAAHGPMFRSYQVQGNRLIVEFDYAEDGLVVAETGTQASQRTGSGIAEPTVIPDGQDRVNLFYIADGDRVWYKARVEIDGSRVILTSPKVAVPRGVAYATGGVGFQPGLYNRALLPMTPFIYYDHQLVTSKSWPDKPLKIDGVVPDPDTTGKRYEYRKMPLLSTQFRDHAVLQAGQPITFWGSAVHNWGYEVDGKAEIHFSFAGIEKTIPVTPGMREWRYTVPAMPASAQPKTLKVVFTIDGQVVHERLCRDIVIGDVWYVAASPKALAFQAKVEPNDQVRVMKRRAKRSAFRNPSRFSVAVSTTPGNRFASLWEPAGEGFAAALGRAIHARTGKPVGIIFMQADDPPLKDWIDWPYLQSVPSCRDDYKQLASVHPGNAYYDAHVRQYVEQWKRYWSQYVMQMLRTRRVPDGAAWGSYPTLAASIDTPACQTYNVLVHSFTPASLKGIVFLCSRKMFEQDQGAHYAEQLSALARCWKDRFAGQDPHLFYTVPSPALAGRVTLPRQIPGKSTACRLEHWLTAEPKNAQDSRAAQAQAQTQRLIDQILSQAYP